MRMRNHEGQPFSVYGYRQVLKADETGGSLDFICSRTQNLYFHLLFGQMKMQELLFLDDGASLAVPF